MTNELGVNLIAEMKTIGERIREGGSNHVAPVVAAVCGFEPGSLRSCCQTSREVIVPVVGCWTAVERYRCSLISLMDERSLGPQCRRAAASVPQPTGRRPDIDARSDQLGR